MKIVKCEPELEEEAALLNPYQRREMARMFERWAHQLRVSAAVLESDDKRPPRRVSLPWIPRRKAALN